MPISLRGVCGCFHAVASELSSSTVIYGSEAYLLSGPLKR